VNSITAFLSEALPRRAVLVIVLASIVTTSFAPTLVIRVVAQASASPSNQPAPLSSALNLRLVFTAYSPIALPRHGTAIMDSGLSRLRDISFTQVSGELSPDGHWIAYDCSGSKRGIHLAKSDGSDAKLVVPLTDDTCVNIRWSPDGKKLSYTGARNQAIRTYDIASNRVTEIPNTERAGWHWWSPAGNEIVYEKRGPSDSLGATGRLLFITDLKGQSQQLTFAKDFEPCAWQGNRIDTWAPAWSKTNKIAFTQCGGLFIISPSGKDLTQLTSDPRTDSSVALPITGAYSPRWSPDGRWILFIGESPCRIRDGTLLKRISPNAKTVVDIGKLPYCGGPFSIAPLRQ
jgi:Tol biopolymer transport system component